MNEIMEMLERKNKEVMVELIKSFKVYLIAIISAYTFSISAIDGLLYKGTVSQTIINSVVAILGIVFCAVFARTYIDRIKRELRQYRGCVTVAIHKKNRLEELEKEERNHIPEID